MQFSHPAFAGLIGVARRDMTPPVGIYARQWGAATHDVAEGVHRPLVATALAIRSGPDEPPVVLVSMDAGWFRVAADEWFVRGAVLEGLGLESARVMVHCTHTHAACSISTCDADKPGGDLIRPYLGQMREAVLSAAQEAVERAAPATLTWATGRCGLAANRDLPDPDGERMVCGFNPDGPADDTLLVGRVTRDADDAVVATLVNYACHPTTLAWENKLISPDYVGAMREVVEGQTGGPPCVFLQGASGELAPREQYTGDVAVADANGRQLGQATVATLATMLPPRQRLAYAGVVESGAPLATWRREPHEASTALDAVLFDVELPLKPLPSEAELTSQLDACTDRVLAERLSRKLQIVKKVGSGPTCLMPAWLWRVGDGVVLGQPNEAYSAFQTTLRERFPDRAVVVMNNVGGSCGYLSPPERHDLDIYQVWQSPFDRDALPRLTETCAQRIEQQIGTRSGERGRRPRSKDGGH